jgi:hypothetical protein
MLGHKTTLDKVKIEIIPYVFFNHNAMKPEMSNKMEKKKSTNI